MCTESFIPNDAIFWLPGKCLHIMPRRPFGRFITFVFAKGSQMTTRRNAAYLKNGPMFGASIFASDVGDKLSFINKFVGAHRGTVGGNIMFNLVSNDLIESGHQTWLKIVENEAQIWKWFPPSDSSSWWIPFQPHHTNSITLLVVNPGFEVICDHSRLFFRDLFRTMFS